MLDDLAGIHDRHFVAQLGEDASLLKKREGRRERRAGAARPCRRAWPGAASTGAPRPSNRPRRFFFEPCAECSSAMQDCLGIRTAGDDPIASGKGATKAKNHGMLKPWRVADCS